MIARLQRRARELRSDGYALYLALRDPRVPWVPKAILGAAALYAVSPIDLIPDFIPVLGLMDDLVIIPLGIALAAKLIPRDIMEEHRRSAREMFASRDSRS